MVAPARRKVALHDPTVYPVEDDMGEDSLQTFIAETLRPLLAALFASRGDKAFVGADQFIYWKQFEPTKVVAPDIYVLPGVAPETRVKSWKVWETGVVPSFALEVMSADARKDIEDSPRRYAELGVKEVVIFDPEPETRDDGIRFRVFRQLAKRGLTLIEATNADRVRSKQLGCFLRVVGRGDATRLRVGVGAEGDTLLPTEAERAKAEAERAKAEQAARERAEAEIARLRAELERARKTTKKRAR
jgi:Uma2 family endonuclease